MKTSHFALAALLFTTPALLAQTPCSKLEIKGSGKAATTLEVNYTGGGANNIAWVVAGEKAGTTKIPLGRIGTLELGLATPFILLPVGRTDSKGNLSLKVNVPKEATTAHEFQVQMMTSKLTITRNPLKISLQFCTSNVVKTSIGGS